MNNQLFIILSIIAVSLFIGIMILFTKQKRFNNVIHIIITAIYTIAAAIINIQFYAKGNYSSFQTYMFVTLFLPLLILLVVLSKQRIFSSITFILNTYITIFTINVLRYLALRYIKIDALIIDSISFVLYPMLWTYVKYFYFDLQNEIDELIPKIIPILFLYAAITLGEIMVYEFLSELFEQSLLRFQIFCAAILSIYFVSFLIFNLLFKAYKNKLVDISYEENLQKEAHYIEGKLETYEQTKSELRILKHDLKHVLITVNQLMSNNQLDEANEYIQNYTAKIDNVVDTRKYSNNPIIDSIISYYVNICEKHNITFNIQLDDFENNLNISDLDFSVFISNCLENAVNATKKLNKNKEITFSLINNKHRFIMQIKNTYNGRIKLDRNNYPIATTKNHGIGTTSIKWFVEKYHWDLNYEISKTHFTISILFNNEVK